MVTLAQDDPAAVGLFASAAFSGYEFEVLAVEVVAEPSELSEPVIPDIDCVVRLSSCTRNCDIIATVVTAQSGNGEPCQTDFEPCKSGEGLCGAPPAVCQESFCPAGCLLNCTESACGETTKLCVHPRWSVTMNVTPVGVAVGTAHLPSPDNELGQLPQTAAECVNYDSANVEFRADMQIFGGSGPEDAGPRSAADERVWCGQLPACSEEVCSSVFFPGHVDGGAFGCGNPECVGQGLAGPMCPPCDCSSWPRIVRSGGR